MTDSNSLDLARFEQMLEVFGPELSRWPESLQGPASELLATTPAARLAREGALQLAALLDAAPEILPSAQLLSRISSLPARHPRGWAAWWPFGGPVAPLMGWAAAAAFGLLVGSGSLPLLDLSTDLDVAQGDAQENDAPLATSGAESGATESSREASAADLDAAGDEDWSDLELALGIGLEWEEEP